MLFKDIGECENCPLLDEGICKGGYTSDGRGNPIEPPCAFKEGNDDVDEFIKGFYRRLD